VHGRFAVPLVLQLLSGSGLQAQASRWGLTPEVGLSRFGGSATRDSAGHESFRPSSSTSIALRMDCTADGIRVAITLLYEKTGIMETGDEVAITLHDLVQLYSVRPELALRLLRLGPGGLWAHGGISLERWQLAGEDPRNRIGALAGLSVSAPLGGGFSMEVRWEGTLSRSVFTQQDLPSRFSLRNTVHSRLGLGLRLGL
jgi:hypothetical protein